ncbi:MAG: bifunctional tetrahydrofolate synthase/dihydrofolate synthase [Xanthomonadales bacterium]|nr:bifunctional tetrahydrofolate synthase/dihydrofolate synthase [Xanthomonadales bacterium]
MSQRPFDAGTLGAWLDYLETCHPADIELGLDRVGRVARRLSLDRPADLVITVAGTNGKGSSVAILEQLLQGGRVGCYTSPHILQYNERIRICGRPASDRAIIDSFRRIERARGDTPLTYFEFGTLAALDLFAGSDLDVALLEVGLGGRLDAVNLVDADAALVTSIGYDHTEWLGDTLEAIAREKAGVFKPGRVAVCGHPDPPEALPTVAREMGSRYYQAGADYGWTVSGSGWEWVCGDLRLKLARPSLPGKHQLQNAAGCLMLLQALRRLPSSAEEISRALSSVNLPGRLQRLPWDAPGVELLIDVGHNPQSADAVADWLAGNPVPGRTWGVVGMLARKNHYGFLRALEPHVYGWCLAGLDSTAAASPDILGAALSGSDKTVFASVGDALTWVRERARRGDRVLVTGSFLTVEAALRVLDGGGKQQ